MKIKSEKIQWLSVALAVVFFVFFTSVFIETAFSEEKNEGKGALGLEKAERLMGQWLRPDGGYVLSLEKFETDGSLKASYFNPKKINVHESFWKIIDEKIYVMVELRDVNYPGSRYVLSYDEKNDFLTGVYFNAAYQQSFEIYFERKR